MYYIGRRVFTGDKMKRIPIAAVTILFLFITAAVFSLSQKNKVLYPNSIVKLSTYTDAKDSDIKIVQDDFSGVTAKLTLGHEAKYPVAGLHFIPIDSFLNLKSYKEIEIVTLPNCDDFNLTLLLFEEGFSQFGRGDTHRYLQLQSTISPHGDTIRHTIRDMPTPFWWFSMNSIEREDLGKRDYSRCSGIAISAHPSLNPGDSSTLAIKSITLKKDNTLPFQIASAAAAMLLVILLIVKLKSPAIRHIPIEPQSVELEPRAKKLFITIARHYSESSFNLEVCSAKTDLSPYHIRKIIQSEHRCSFPDYLKLVRIIEAERLLLETESDIKEIAYRVGFSHPSSFARSFKEKNGTSPSQFRESGN